MTNLLKAQLRVGNSSEDRARWLLGCLATGSPEHIAPDELDRLVWEWGVFLGVAEKELPLEMDQARDFQTRAYKAIEQVVYGKAGWRVSIVESHTLKLEVSLGLTFNAEIAKNSHFEWKLVSLLRQVKNHLLRCNRDGCRNVFVRIRRQKFCSEKCSQRDRMDRYRNKKRKVAPLPTAYFLTDGRF